MSFQGTEIANQMQKSSSLRGVAKPQTIHTESSYLSEKYPKSRESAQNTRKSTPFSPTNPRLWFL